MEKRTNNEWIADLRAGGDRQTQALEDLRAIIVEGLSIALAGKLSPDDPEFETFINSIAQKTIAQGLEHLNDFGGLSAFTTWAFKIAVRQALYELRQKHRPVVSATPALPDIPSELYDKLAQEVAMSLEMKRCDYFNMIHDARIRLKKRLEVDGWLSVEGIEKR